MVQNISEFENTVIEYIKNLKKTPPILNNYLHNRKKSLSLFSESSYVKELSNRTFKNELQVKIDSRLAYQTG